MRKQLPSREVLLNLFRYHTVTGHLYWRHNVANVPCGTVAGTLCDNGYVQISIDGILYKAHRLIWQYMYGFIPEGLDIDHIDGARNNNRLSNLRLASVSNNMCNRKVSKGTKTGIKGLHLTPSGTYYAHVKVAGKRISRTFKSQEDAIIWLTATRKALHTLFANNG